MTRQQFCHPLSKHFFVNVRYEPRPLGKDDVAIKITCCGICHSDIHTIDSDWGGADYPVIPGHEIIGVVTQVGSGVTQHKVGDRVGVGALVWSCLSCNLCHKKLDNVCPKRVFTYNANYADGAKAYGGYASHVRVQQEWAFNVPSNISDEKAAPLLCAGII
jgi:alcohol dehydrogenase (NADP+)